LSGRLVACPCIARRQAWALLAPGQEKNNNCRNRMLRYIIKKEYYSFSETGRRRRRNGRELG
jgi:hypothetical protein